MVLKDSIAIAQNPEIIWDYLMDVQNDVYWRDGIVKARWTSQAPHGMGSKGEHTHKNMGVLYWEVTGFENGKSFEFIHTAGGLKGSIAFFQVEPEGKGSRVRIRMKITGPFIMRFLQIFMGSMMRKSVEGDLQKLKENLEKPPIST